MSTEFDFESLVGTEADFYGVDNHCFKLDDVIYESVEDEDDGYRSMLDCVQINEEAKASKIFFGLPIARVVVESEDDGYFRGYKLTDLHDSHEWLRFGTEDYDDWYPMFRFEYSPKPSQD
jgi:hypothetical protein